VAQRLISAFTRVFDALVSAFTRVFDALVSAFTRVFDALISAFTRVFDALRGQCTPGLGHKIAKTTPCKVEWAPALVLRCVPGTRRKMDVVMAPT
jgi:Flp pilus assembly pilin Flp